jgi:hypothetical protein
VVYITSKKILFLKSWSVCRYLVSMVISNDLVSHGKNSIPLQAGILISSARSVGASGGGNIFS